MIKFAVTPRWSAIGSEKRFRLPPGHNEAANRPSGMPTSDATVTAWRQRWEGVPTPNPLHVFPISRHSSAHVAASVLIIDAMCTSESIESGMLLWLSSKCSSASSTHSKVLDVEEDEVVMVVVVVVVTVVVVVVNVVVVVSNTLTPGATMPTPGSAEAVNIENS